MKKFEEYVNEEMARGWDDASMHMCYVGYMEDLEERIKELEKICKHVTRFCDCGYAIERGKKHCTNTSCENYRAN